MIFSEKLYELYFRMPTFSYLGIFGKIIIKIYAKILKKILDSTLPQYYMKTRDKQSWGLYTGQARKEKIICSMTSFPARINIVWISIEALMRQTLKPDRIILWLTKKELREIDLPDSLNNLRKRGLDVYFCDDNLKAHKKYLHSLEMFPDDLVVTVDDDTYYDRNMLQNLIEIHKNNGSCIATNRAHKIRVKKGLEPYRNWEHNTTYSVPSFSIFATGCYGVVYKKEMLDSDYCDTKLFKSMSFNADDIWLKIMSLKKGTRVVTNAKYDKDPIMVGGSQKEKLVNQNVMVNGNDEQLKNLTSYYHIKAKEFKD